MKKTIINILLTTSLISGCSTFQLNSKEEIIIDCFNKACKIEYDQELLGEDYWKSPLETIKDKKGDCEDKAFYLEYLLKRNRIECKTIIGAVNYLELKNRKNGPIELHAWVEY